MPARARRIDPDKYARLIAASLAVPPRNAAENERLIELLSDLDERDNLTVEEETFAELLAIIIEDFEQRHYALPDVAPHEALNALMEDRGLRHKDVWPVVGNKGLTTEILNGRRKIGAALAKKLALHFHVPVELFI
jgi:HTH-type transcriptional regulator/antitoxin HigA